MSQKCHAVAGRDLGGGPTAKVQLADDCSTLSDSAAQQLMETQVNMRRDIPITATIYVRSSC